MSDKSCTLSLQEDSWLSSTIGVKSSKIHVQSIEQYINCLPQIVSDKPFFHTIKATSGKGFGKSSSLTGLLYIQKMVQYSWQGSRPSKKKLEILIRNFGIEDKSSILDITKGAFHLSRFHTDPRFSSELAEKIKREWVLNNITVRPNIRTLVAIADREVSGYCCLVNSSNTVTIDLIATKPDLRGNGIGSALIRASQHFAFSVNKQLLVGTQESNPANSLYQKCGFNRLTNQLIWHHLSIDRIQ